MNKVYCRYCGKEIDEDATFCTYCGKEQNVKQKSSNTIGLGRNKRSFFYRLCAMLRNPIKNIKMPRITRGKSMLWNKRLKHIGRILLTFSAIALVVAAVVYGIVYYYDKYLPQKRLDEACTDILNKFRSSQDSVKIEYSRRILLNTPQWEYVNVSDESITHKLEEYRSEAFESIEKSAVKGVPYVQYLLGQMYIGHISTRFRHSVIREYAIKPDTVKAVYWWNEAAKRKFVRAYNKIGVAYRDGIGGVQPDIKKAVKYFRLGAENGEPYAQANYGRLFKEGVKIWIGSHEEMRRSVGCYYGFKEQKVREYYDNSIGETITIYKQYVDDYEWLIPQNIEKAKYWWKKSAAQGNRYAKDMLQQVYEEVTSPKTYNEPEEPAA